VCNVHFSTSKELLLTPVIISRNEKEKVLIEGSVNSLRISIAVKQVCMTTTLPNFLKLYAAQFCSVLVNVHVFATYVCYGSSVYLCPSADMFLHFFKKYHLFCNVLYWLVSFLSGRTTNIHGISSIIAHVN